MEIKEEPSRSDSDVPGPADTSQTDNDTSALEVTMKMDSSSTDAGTSLAEDSSFVTREANASPCDNSSQQMSPEKNVPPTSDSAAVTATKIAADERGPTAASTEKSTESPAPVTSDILVDNATLSSPGTSLATSPEKKKNENTDDSVDKSKTSEDSSGNVTTSSPIVNKT